MGNDRTSLSDRKKTVVDNIISNYRQIEKSIVNQLYMKHNLHGTTIGTEREDIWRQLFEMIIPKKFVIEQSVFIIDSKEGVSNEVDLAILDENYTPYIFRYGHLKFIPIEAVAAVVECKSKSLDPQAIQTWSESILQLRTDNNSIARIATQITNTSVDTQQSTRPLRILCALGNELDQKITEHFDFVLLAKEQQSIEISCSLSNRAAEKKVLCNPDSLEEWFWSLNYHEEEKNDALLKGEIVEQLQNTTMSSYKVIKNDEDISLLSFNFQLNQLLMLINNPILFPHKAYVDMFNGVERRTRDE